MDVMNEDVSTLPCPRAEQSRTVSKLNEDMNTLPYTRAEHSLTVSKLNEDVSTLPYTPLDFPATDCGIVGEEGPTDDVLCDFALTDSLLPPLPAIFNEVEINQE